MYKGSKLATVKYEHLRDGWEGHMTLPQTYLNGGHAGGGMHGHQNSKTYLHCRPFSLYKVGAAPEGTCLGDARARENERR